MASNTITAAPQVTSVFSAPARCTSIYRNDIDILSLGQSEAASVSACFPSGWASSANSYLSGSLCPDGYSFAFSTALGDITAGTCCPSSFSTVSGQLADPTNAFFTGMYCTSEFDANSTFTIITTNDLGSYTPSAFTATSGDGINAYGVSLRWAAATSTSSSSTTASTTSASPTPTAAPDTGLSTGAKAGIGVGVAVGVLAIIAIFAFLFWRKRRASKAAAAAPNPQYQGAYGQPSPGMAQYGSPASGQAHMAGGAPPNAQYGGVGTDGSYYGPGAKGGYAPVQQHPGTSPQGGYAQSPGWTGNAPQEAPVMHEMPAENPQR